jgi:nucleoside-diphosphate-sugar epimerase
LKQKPITTISILGAGWLGFALAESLVEKGYNIKASSTTKAKLQSIAAIGAEAHFLKLCPGIEAHNFAEFINSQLLVICIPPREAINGTGFHLQQIQKLINAIPDKQKLNIIYTSSTSVYQPQAAIVTEESPIQIDSTLIKAENALRKIFSKTTVLRLGGLMGPNRFPAKYYSQKPVPQPHEGVNYLHQADAIAAIEHIIRNNLWGQIYNVVAPQHPSRQQVIEHNCTAMQLPLPKWAQHQNNLLSKTISTEKILATGFIYSKPDPNHFFNS